MTVELITGYSGTPHIGSDDVQHLIAGIVGGGSYALDTGKKLAIAVNSANSVTVDTGDAIIAGGAHVRVAAAEKLTVTSGAQGVKRNDLVCLRYTKASDNKESAALVVVKGTATSGTPADPAVNTGSVIDGKATVDMPLYRLPLNGVSLGTPVKLFSVSPTLASLGDSVSQQQAANKYSTAETDTGRTWVDGKKIYRRVVRLGNFSSGETRKSIGFEYGNLVSAVFLSGSSSESTTGLLPQYESDDDWRAEVTLTGTTAIARIGSSYGGCYITGIFEYTK